jgi:hypothetical protein
MPPMQVFRLEYFSSIWTATLQIYTSRSGAGHGTTGRCHEDNSQSRCQLREAGIIRFLRIGAQEPLFTHRVLTEFCMGLKFLEMTTKVTVERGTSLGKNHSRTLTRSSTLLQYVCRTRGCYLSTLDLRIPGS